VVVVRGDHGSRLQWRLRVSGALLLAVSAGIHLDLYLTGYRKIPTIGWLFLLQVIVGFVLTLAALVTRSRLAAAASAALALSTLGAYLLAAFATLALAALTADPARHAAGPAGSTPRVRARAQSAVSLVVGVVSGVSVAALALLGVAVVRAPASPEASAEIGGTLKTAKIGGVDVLTNANGLTLYWFAPDTSTSSACTGSCAIYWPPVPGSPTAGPGVTGRLGAIKRSGGGLQATYDGHPLYTYIGDRGPGQANGNDLDLNGGFWYDIRVPR
jgi:predicted lipoprotein with Yx(FWY)xxD motif